jgi:hypothetical protein
MGDFVHGKWQAPPGVDQAGAYCSAPTTRRRFDHEIPITPIFAAAQFALN